MNDKNKSVEGKKKTAQRIKDSDRISKQYVEELLETDMEQIEHILVKIKFITPDQYKDVVEERSIINNCGYPLCGNKLETTPKKQKYLIRKNKVFDITTRKMFCSNKCYESSATLQSKVPTTALWLRDKENDIILSEDVSGKHGEEVELLSKISKEVLNDLKNDRKKKVVTFQDENDIMVKEEAVINDDDCKSVHENNVVSIDKEEEILKTDSVKPKLTHAPKPFDFYQMSLKTMHEWMTRSTLEYLGLQKKETAKEEICNEKKLEELNEYKMKVEHFFKGNYITIKPEETKKKIEIKENQTLSDVQLPTVDNVSQMRIRRKILHQRLSGYATSIIPVLGMHAPSLLHEFRQLITTFELSSMNTMLQQPQLPIVTVIMLVLLTNINNELSQRLKSSESVFNKLLKAFDVGMNQLRNDIDMQLIKTIVP